ncbi:MAG: hypothetical protein OXT67_00640 [Zetaproteobacteria bacterium]|nr:hypothetical protein [Zetaproteobacteria bacterium]
MKAWGMLVCGLGLQLVMTSKVLCTPSINLGYHNPIFSKYGINLLFMSDNLGLEIGLGGVDGKIDVDDSTESAEEDSGSRLNMIGSINGKYYLGSGKARIYLQLGMGLAAGAEDGEGSYAAGNTAYFGGGLWLGGEDLYFYGSYNTTGPHTFTQAGIGFAI